MHLNSNLKRMFGVDFFQRVQVVLGLPPIFIYSRKTKWFVLQEYIASVDIFCGTYSPCNIYIFAQNEAVHVARIYCFSEYFCRTYLPCNIYIFMQNEAVCFSRMVDE
jgi:hypothetical protein